ncbi:DUF1573 domain-containing protein [Chryseobacterium sp.]|uniref:DUF1573 domain-containing protein n=1 Tax=Chryseobacterium sp. TaxID=1871047 RepID=UPI00289FAE57|nr:DUF1573 domain-containing protein [Chryseobacterium sp.]
MKKTLSIIALSVIGFGLVSCKKEAKETIGTETLSADSTQAPALDSLAAPAVSGDSAATAAPAKPATTIALSESNFDFGTIKKGDKVEHVYEVTNTGNNPLVISAVTPGCGCTAGDFTKEPILPGKKGKITLHFDSTNFDGAVNKYADVFANVEKAPIKLTFTANIQP